MDLIWRDSNLKKKKVIPKASYACSVGLYGSSKNDFSLTLPIGETLPIGDFVTYGSTEHGGCILEKIINTKDGTVQYVGKSLRGQLENSVINPFSTLEISGTIDEIVESIISKSTLNYIVDYSGIADTKTITLPKSSNALKAIDLAMNAFGTKFKITINENLVHIVIMPIKVFKHDASQISLIVDENKTLPTALHAYNDKYTASVYLQEDGTVGTSRYFSGFSAVEITQEISSNSSAQLFTLASDKLLALRTSITNSEIQIDLSDEDIGDKIEASVKQYNIKVVQTVIEKTLEIQGNNKEFSFNTGG